MTRRIQDEAAATFEALFLAGKGDTLSAIDALALFYDFRELTPIGRRGDEMIRRLADRLVSVDLLDQAADLLQYQVDHRLQGAARAQVATRLAVDLSDEPQGRSGARDAARHAAPPILPTNCAISACCWKRARCPISAAHDLALEVVANIDGREAIRLRSDILWAARRWAPIRRADRALLRRALEGLAAAERSRARRHPARRDRLCARRGCAGLGPLPREIRGEDGADAGRAATSRWSRRRSAPTAPNSVTSRAPRPRSIRSTDSCATCRRAIRMRARFRHRRQRRRRATGSAPAQVARTRPAAASLQPGPAADRLRGEILRSARHARHIRRAAGNAAAGGNRASRRRRLSCRALRSGAQRDLVDSRMLKLAWSHVLLRPVPAQIKSGAGFSGHALVVHENRQQDDDRQRDAEQPKQ